MRRTIGSSLIVMAVSMNVVFAQGTFGFANFEHPTRLGTIDGPLANTEYWGQMLAGPSPDELFAVGDSLPHFRNGTIGGLIVVTVTGIECRQFAYIQFVAWDGDAWGTDLQLVPEHQLGRTDIVSHLLAGCLGDPETAPRFTQPAVVPPIPEPSTMALLLLAVGMALLSPHRLHRNRP